MKKMTNVEGKAIGIVGLWAMIGIATLPILGPAVLTGTMANICYGIGIMQSVNILFLKDKEEDNYMLKVSEFIEKYHPYTIQFIYYLDGQYFKELASIYAEDEALDIILEKADFQVYAYSYFEDLHLLILSI